MTTTSSQHATAVACVAAAGTLAGLIYLSRPFFEKLNKHRQILSEYLSVMDVSVEKMRAIKADFLKEVEAGLAGKPSSLLMLPSMIDVLPTGNETGSYFAIDVGGTNMRMVHIELSPEKGQVASREMEDFPIPDAHFSVPAPQLFDLMASSMIKFTNAHGIPFSSQNPPRIGFCFSFPCQHTAFDAGVLLKLTKRFTNPGAVGTNPATALTEAFQRQGVKVRVAALLNDAVGTLAGGRYFDDNVVIGMIVGTGTNACYIEQVTNVKRLPDDAVARNRTDYMLINTEWGNFNSPQLPTTEADRDVDAMSPNPGQYLFEKQMSGMYLGEVARRILLRLVAEADLFGLAGKLPEKLTTEWGFPTAGLSAIDHDRSWDLHQTGQTLGKYLGITSTSYITRWQVKQVCHLIAERSARLCATAIAALLHQMGKDCPGSRVSITVDGGLYEHYKAYRGYVHDALVLLLGKQCAAQVSVNQLRDASSFGTAFLAAAAEKATAPVLDT